MYLYVEFFNSYGAYEDSMMGVSSVSSHKRIEKIKLTPKQIEQLKPQLVRNDYGQDLFEQMNILCIQEK